MSQRQAYRIAIVGSYDPARVQELQLRNVELAPQAGEDIGQALAKKGYHIIVYSDYKYLFEVDVVRGYTKAVQTEPDCIEVRYSSASATPKFAEQKPDDPRFLFLPDVNPNWEMSFYQSIAQIDGMILLGGGPSTLIAGIVALGHKKPIVVCAGFGGEARNVWQALISQTSADLKDEVARMSSDGWSPNSADRLVTMLDAQLQIHEQEKLKQLQAEQERFEDWIKSKQKENVIVNGNVLLAITSLLLAIVVYAISASSPQEASRSWSVLLLISALLTGVTGSSTSVVFDKVVGAKTRILQPIPVTSLLGAVAGFAAAALFVLAQVVANPSDSSASGPTLLYDRLTLYTTIVGLVAGLTFEAVFSRLKSIDVVRPGPISAASPDGTNTNANKPS